MAKPEPRETISFDVSNASFEIDVCQAHEKGPRSKLAPFGEYARRQARSQSRKRVGVQRIVRTQPEVRAWAKKHGLGQLTAKRPGPQAARQ